jgi:hypothetical protein
LLKKTFFGHSNFCGN